MAVIMRVFFWQNIPSHIQAPALRIFTGLWPDEVHGIWCGEIPPHRRSLGWEDPDFGALHQTLLPRDYHRQVQSLIQ